MTAQPRFQSASTAAASNAFWISYDSVSEDAWGRILYADRPALDLLEHLGFASIKQVTMSARGKSAVSGAPSFIICELPPRR